MVDIDHDEAACFGQFLLLEEDVACVVGDRTHAAILRITQHSCEQLLILNRNLITIQVIIRKRHLLPHMRTVNRPRRVPVRVRV